MEKKIFFGGEKKIWKKKIVEKKNFLTLNPDIGRKKSWKKKKIGEKKNFGKKKIGKKKI